MAFPLTALVCSTLALVIIAGVFRVEDAREGKLLMLSGFRVLFDRFVVYIAKKLSTFDTYIGRGFARIVLHYAAHGLLERLLLVLKKGEKRVEQLLRRNKQAVKGIKHNKKRNHLDEIADHKQEFALSDAQKEKMRSHE